MREWVSFAQHAYCELSNAPVTHLINLYILAVYNPNIHIICWDKDM